MATYQADAVRVSVKRPGYVQSFKPETRGRDEAGMPVVVFRRVHAGHFSVGFLETDPGLTPVPPAAK